MTDEMPVVPKKYIYILLIPVLNKKLLQWKDKRLRFTISKLKIIPCICLPPTRYTTCIKLNILADNIMFLTGKSTILHTSTTRDQPANWLSSDTLRWIPTSCTKPRGAMLQQFHARWWPSFTDRCNSLGLGCKLRQPSDSCFLAGKREPYYYT